MTAPDMQTRLAEPFPAAEVRQFKKEWTNKQGEKKSAGPFDFIEDETVMDRLDAVVGIGNWYVHTTPIGDTAVRVVLGVRFDPESAFVEYEDFGYATRTDSPEPYKEAVSDGIRRCGRYVGIARYLYRKHDAADIVASKKLAENLSAARGDGLVGVARIGDRLTSDGELRESLMGPDGEKLDEPIGRLGFRLEPREGDRGAILVEAWGDLAAALLLTADQWQDQPVTCWGSITQRSFAKGKTDIKYQALVLSRMQTPTGTIPAEEGGPEQAPEAQAADVADGSGTETRGTTTDPAPTVKDAQPERPDAAVAAGRSEATRSTETPESTDIAQREAGAPATDAALGTGVATPPADNQCDSASPYGDNGRCELLEGHKGPHKLLSVAFPESWTDR